MSRLFAPLLALALLLSASIALAVGERPQDFRLNQLAGPPITLSDHLGEKVILMSFWATWCSPCKAEMPQVHCR